MSVRNPQLPGATPAALILLCLFTQAAAWAQAPGLAPTREQMVAMLATIDSRSQAPGDLRALVVAETRKGQTTSVRELQLFRRDREQKFMILLTAPRTESGKGYLSEKLNLWMYDPRVGRWDRRTERESIGGTDSRRSDLDHTQFAALYEPTYKGTQKLGALTAHWLQLKARSDDVAYPVLELWIDTVSGNMLKRQEFALSGTLLRTALFPRWNKVPAAQGEKELWFPEQIQIFDELIKGNQTSMVIKSVDNRPLAANVFTKAWLESKSR